jgi:N-acetylglutamate synthase-like GNAT family acetyltransferase
VIRRARLDDAEAVFALLAQLAVSYPVAWPRFEAMYPVTITDDRSIVLVSETAGRVHGYALAVVTPLLHVGGESAQLHELVVNDGDRGAGHGTALLAALEAECSERGVRQVVVASRRAAGFYVDRGYETTAEYLKRVL